MQERGGEKARELVGCVTTLECVNENLTQDGLVKLKHDGKDNAVNPVAYTKFQNIIAKCGT